MREFERLSAETHRRYPQHSGDIVREFSRSQNAVVSSYPLSTKFPEEKRLDLPQHRHSRNLISSGFKLANITEEVKIREKWARREPPSSSTVISDMSPPSIMPVVILSGVDYQMGYQYGQQAGQYIEWRKDAAWVNGLRVFGSREAVIRELKAAQYYGKQCTPEAIDQMKGMAEGATSLGYKISYLDVLLINTQISKLRRVPTAVYPSRADGEIVLTEECSNWSAWGRTTTDGRLICSKSSDAIFEPQVSIVAFPQDGNSYLGTAVAGEVSGAPCINNKGLFIGTSGGFATRDIDFDYGIPVPPIFQHLLRFTETASKAKDIFCQWKYPRSTIFHFSDVRGNAFVIEVTAAVKGIRQAGDFDEVDFIYSTNNYFLAEMKDAIKGERFVEHAGWVGGSWSISSVARNLQLWNMLHNYQGKVDLKFAEMMWRFPGNPPPYPLDENSYYLTQGKGWDQKICNLLNQRIGIMFPDDGNHGMAYLCTGPAGRIAYPLHPNEGDTYQVDGPHTFYQLCLGASPVAVVESAKKEAHACIASAHREITKLSYSDTKYLSVKELWSKAIAEYYRGTYMYHKGELARGDEGMLFLAQAATAYTRSQAISKEAYDALVPPAMTPEDLGLHP